MSGSIREGNLHNWFSKSKSKDGKPGWVQSDGSPCANEKGETKTPKCYSSQRLAGLKKSESGKKKIRSADSRKSKEDSGQQQKSGGAAPTNVRTFTDPKDYKKHKSGDYKPKKMKKEQFSNWRVDTPEPLINEFFGLGKKKENKSKSSWGTSNTDAVAKARFNNEVKSGNIQKGSTTKFNPKTNSTELVAPPKKKVAGTKYEPPTQPKPESKPPVATKPPSPKTQTDKPNKSVEKSKPDKFSGVKKTLKSAGQTIKNNIKSSVPSAPGKIVTQQGNQKEQFSNWRDDYVATEHEFIDLITPEPMVGISETKEGQMKAGREQYKKEKEEGRYGGTKPSNERVAKLMKKLKEENKQDGPEPTRKQTRGAMKNIRSKMNTASHKDPDKKKTKQELAFQKARAKAWGMTEGKEEKRKDAMPEGDVGYEIHKKAVAQYNKQNPSKKVKEEFEISEEDKKGSGSGKKDACYKKVKASASVWPSAYASGRLVQCRKKGAANYGNSKNEEVEVFDEGLTGERATRARQMQDTEIKKGGGKRTDADRDTAFRLGTGTSEDRVSQRQRKGASAQGKGNAAKRRIKEETLDELKCWKGYKRKKGATPGAPGSCVKAGYSDWRGDLDLMEGVGAWQRKEGKNKEGGLNEKGRKSYERENPGSDLKAPQPEGGSRKKSFCARMSGMKKKLTSSKTANDPDSRINKSLRKWKC